MEFQYTYKHEGSDNKVLYLDCTLEYEPEELGSWSDGLQQEPNYPAQVNLYTALVDSTFDIYDMLNACTIDAIEKQAQIYYEGDK